ncbi:MAG: hypothetical protein IKX75_04940 [Desulfovibrio sp.]|nr:hypothetical protein [Desulfovibrio sp.]
MLNGKGDGVNALFLFSKDIPLVEFRLKPDGGGVDVCRIFPEHECRMPHVLQGRSLERLLPAWLWHRFSSSGRWLVRALEQCGMPQDLPSILQTTCALSLTDAFWVHDGTKSWAQENLFENSFSEEIANLAISRGLAPEGLRPFGRSPEYTSDGSLRKCWRRDANGLSLLKADSAFPGQVNQATAEWLAWKVAEVLSLDAVEYSLESFVHVDGSRECVSSCPIFTSPDAGYVPALDCLRLMDVKEWMLDEMALETPAAQDAVGEAMGRDAYGDMMLFDSLIGNADRHLGNFGMLFDTSSGKILRMAPVFDSGMSFMSRIDWSGKSEQDLFRNWKRGFVMTFDEMAERFVHERHREALERLLDFRFPETPFIAEDALCLSERFLHKRAERALQCLQRQAKRPSSVSVP